MKKINLFDNKLNQTSYFGKSNWFKTNYNSHGTYDAGNIIRFKTLRDYINAYIHANGTIATQTWQLELKLQQMPIRK